MNLFIIYLFLASVSGFVLKGAFRNIFSLLRLKWLSMSFTHQTWPMSQSCCLFWVNITKFWRKSTSALPNQLILINVRKCDKRSMQRWKRKLNLASRTSFLQVYIVLSFIITVYCSHLPNITSNTFMSQAVHIRNSVIWWTSFLWACLYSLFP